MWSTKPTANKFARRVKHFESITKVKALFSPKSKDVQVDSGAVPRFQKT
jgi:hypothetical protein